VRQYFLFPVLVSVLLCGCGGGGGGSMTSTPVPVSTAPSGGSSTQSQSESAIATSNAFGAPLEQFSSFDDSISPPTQGGGPLARTRLLGNGTCLGGFEFFSPDSAGDPHSTEVKNFYDFACTDLARDIVRIYSANGSSAESVQFSEELFSPENATPIAARTASRSISNATFDAFGFPIAADGFDETATASLAISGTTTIQSGAELVALATASGTNDFCSDGAAFNTPGFPALNETFGWQGGVLSGGSRTVNSDGSITWTAVHTGSVSKGPVGSFSVQSGTENTACPITTPMFTLAGGTSLGSYSVPVVVTFQHGMIQSLSIQNATLINGTTLTVSTNSAQQPTSNQFITGTISQNGAQIATFSVDAFGDGSLTITASGKQFAIIDFYVVH